MRKRLHPVLTVSSNMENYVVKSIKGMAVIKVLSKPIRERLVRSLTLVNKFNAEPLELYEQHDRFTLSIPRGLVDEPADPKEWEEAHIKFVGELRPEQESLVASFVNHIETKNGGIIQSPVGSGKTVIAVAVMARLNLKTLIVVPTDHLMRQWHERLKAFSVLRDRDIGMVRGNICDFTNKKVVIGMIHSLCKPGRYPSSLYDSFGLVVTDECHKVSAPTFSQMMPMFHSKYRLGLSATPRRKDGLENVFFYHIGKVCAPVPKQRIKPSIVLVKYKGLDAHHKGCSWNGQLSLGKYHNKLALSYERNKFLAGLVCRTYNKDRDVLLLCDRIGIIENVKNMAVKMGLPDNAIGIFTGSKKVGLDRRVILATYGSAGLGADIPRLSTLILATPRTDVEQAVGRILRGFTGKEPVVIDVVDEASHIMRIWSASRLRFYKTITDKITVL